MNCKVVVKIVNFPNFAVFARPSWKVVNFVNFVVFARSSSEIINFAKFAVFARPSQKIVNFVNFVAEFNSGHKWYSVHIWSNLLDTIIRDRLSICILNTDHVNVGTSLWSLLSLQQRERWVLEGKDCIISSLDGILCDFCSMKGIYATCNFFSQTCPTRTSFAWLLHQYVLHM